MQVFFRNCTHILTRTQGKKFEDMFLVKIASKGTSLKARTIQHQEKFHLKGLCRLNINNQNQEEIRSPIFLCGTYDKFL